MILVAGSPFSFVQGRVICGGETTFSYRLWEYGDILVHYRDRMKGQGRIFDGPPGDDGHDGRRRAMGRLTGW